MRIFNYDVGHTNGINWKWNDWNHFQFYFNYHLVYFQPKPHSVGIIIVSVVPIANNMYCIQWIITWYHQNGYELHSSPKVMAVFVQYQNLYDNLFGLIWFLACVYLGSLSVFLVNLIEIGRIFIACEASKLGIEGIWEIKFLTKQLHGSI